MKVYIRKGFDNEIANHNFYAAYDGFKQMGFEICYFQNFNEITDNDIEDIIVGYVDDVRSIFFKHGVIAPEIDYPDDLKDFLGRKIWTNWREHFNYKVVENAILEYKSAPNGYAIDFGLTDKGETLLIEVNDGYALGHYGLFSLDYAKLLSARWAELTSTIDECNF